MKDAAFRTLPCACTQAMFVLCLATSPASAQYYQSYYAPTTLGPDTAYSAPVTYGYIPAPVTYGNSPTTALTCNYAPAMPVTYGYAAGEAATCDSGTSYGYSAGYAPYTY